VTAAVQIQASHSDPDPNNHTSQDTYDKINRDYFFEQIKATTAMAGHLAVPIAGEEKIFLPVVRMPNIYNRLEW
jgi:hypothetical protein